MDGSNQWSAATTNDQDCVKPLMKKQTAYSDSYASSYNEQNYENVNKGYYSANHAQVHSSKKSYNEVQSSYTDAQVPQLPSKRQSFNTPSYQPSKKRPNIGRTTYLSDKRNQFNLTTLKGEKTSDNQGTNNYQSASDSINKPTNTGTNYQWTPTNSVTNYQWTPNYQWNNTSNSFQGTPPVHNQNVQASQEKNSIHLNSTKDGIILSKPDSTQQQDQSSMEGKFHTNKCDAVDERIKQLYNETLKEKENTGRDSNPGSRYDSGNAGRIGWGSDNAERGGRNTTGEFQRDTNYGSKPGGMYGVDLKFGGKFKERGGRILDNEFEREGRIDKREPGIDERFAPQGGRRFEDSSRDEKIGGNKQHLHPEESGVVNQKYDNQNYSSILNRGSDGMRQQYEKPASTFSNNPTSGKNITGENYESQTIEKDSNITDKDRIKQMLIDHANKSVLNYQIPTVNTFASNYIRVLSNANIPLISALNPATAAVNSTTNTNVIVNAVKSLVNNGKPNVKSAVNSAMFAVKPTTNTYSSTNAVKPIENTGKTPMKSTVNSATSAVKPTTSTNCTVNAVKSIVNDGKPPMKSAVNSATSAVKPTTSTNSTTDVVTSTTNTVTSTVKTVPVNTGKPPVKSAVNSTVAVSSTTTTNSTANDVKSVDNADSSTVNKQSVDTGKPPVNSDTKAVNSTTINNSTANVVKSAANTVSSTVNIPCKPANVDSNPSNLVLNQPSQIRPSMGTVASVPAGKHFVKSGTKFNANAGNSTMDTNSTANILKSALSTVNAVRSPSYPIANSRGNAAIRPMNPGMNPRIKHMNPALNPVINAALQYLPRAAVPLARANSPLFLRYNTMPASLFRHPVLNNMTIPNNQGSTFYANQSIRQNLLSGNIRSGQNNSPSSISQGRFRYS